MPILISRERTFASNASAARSRARTVALGGFAADRAQARLKEEVGNHARLDHEHVIRVVEVVQTADVCALVLEYVGGGDLFEYIIRRFRSVCANWVGARRT